ncbi:MAG: protein-glutamate O-methyltransferase CheR [Myxococcota bacterium]|nr:protein-glutamate O-methyltransferase CheR [Myxococcota bacterium]
MPLTQSEYETIRKLVLNRSGIVLDTHKQAFTEQKLGPLAEEHGLTTLSDVVQKVASNPTGPLMQKVVEAITTPETGFFRDNRAFKALKEAVFPKLIEKRGMERALNIWSGACSTGQEPYSILMQIHENFPELKGWTIRFIATDISSKVLAQAKEGVFSQLEMNRGLPAPLLLKYFQKNGLQWQVKPVIRSLVDFRVLNLIEQWPPLPKMDIIFMRNVLVYFETETKRKILNKVADSLKPGGHLFLGMAEIPMTSENRFDKLEYERSGCFVLK